MNTVIIVERLRIIVRATVKNNILTLVRSHWHRSCGLWLHVPSNQRLIILLIIEIDLLGIRLYRVFKLYFK